MTSARSLAADLCAALSSEERELLREDPFEAMDLVAPEVTIRLVEEPPPEDGCSVEGMYNELTRTITVQRATSQRRTKFTALHEFGHDRARHDGGVAGAMAKLSPAASRRFEEKIADAFAAAVLIPDEVVDDICGGTAPTAESVTALFHDGRASGSREACCVRIAERMRGDGYVLVAEGNTVRFCATVGGAYQVGRGARQEPGSLLDRAARGGRATDLNVTLRHTTGTPTPPYAGQAVADGLYVFAVLTDATTLPWGGWVPPRGRDGDAPEIFCSDCDDVSEAWRRCDTVPAHRVCSACGWCECKVPQTALPERQCTECFSLKHAALFPPGSDICSDCR